MRCCGNQVCSAADWILLDIGSHQIGDTSGSTVDIDFLREHCLIECERESQENHRGIRGCCEFRGTTRECYFTAKNIITRAAGYEATLLCPVIGIVLFQNKFLNANS